MYTNNFLWLCIGIMSRAAVQTAGHCQCMLEHVCGWGFSNNTFSFDFIYLLKCSNKMTFILHILFVSCLCVADRPTDGTNEQTTDPSFHLLVLLQGPPLCVKGFLFRLPRALDTLPMLCVVWHDENWKTVGQSNSITRCYFTFFPPFLLRLLLHRYYPVKERKNVLSFGFLWTLVTSFFLLIICFCLFQDNTLIAFVNFLSGSLASS